VVGIAIRWVLVVDDNLIGTRPERIARENDLFRNGASHRRRNCLHFDTSRFSSRDDHTDGKLSRTLARQHDLRIGTVGAVGLG
jgi:hypothetical protein